MDLSWFYSSLCGFLADENPEISIQQYSEPYNPAQATQGSKITFFDPANSTWQVSSDNAINEIFTDRDTGYSLIVRYYPLEKLLLMAEQTGDVLKSLQSESIEITILQGAGDIPVYYSQENLTKENFSDSNDNYSFVIIPDNRFEQAFRSGSRLKVAHSPNQLFFLTLAGTNQGVEKILNPNDSVKTGGSLTMSFDDETWIEIHDIVEKKLILADLRNRTSPIALETSGAVEILVGNVTATTLVVDGEVEDLSQRAFENVARIQLWVERY